MSLNPPNIPRMPASVPREIQRAFDSLADFFRRAGNEGGLATTSALAEEIAGTAIDTSAPPQMTGLVVTGLFDKIMLEWDAYSATAQIEIHRAETDDLGVAVQVGQCPSSQSLFVDVPPDSSLSVTYYYWIRANRNGTPGPWNQTAGTAGRTADDPEYLLEIASEKWKASFNYSVADLALPTKPNGYVYEVTVDAGSSGASEPTWPTVIDNTVVDGGVTWKCKAAFSFETFFKVALVAGTPRLTLKELYLADGIIKNAMIANLAVDNAKIADLSVAKLLAGVITASNIFLGAESKVHLDGANNQIVVKDASNVTRVILGKLSVGHGLEIYASDGSLILGSGGVPLAKVTGAGAFAGLSQITAANISTYIASLAVGTLQIANQAVTIPAAAFTTAEYLNWDSVHATYVTVQSLAVSATGAPATIAVTVEVEKRVGGDAYVKLRILRDGSTIYEISATNGFRVQGSFSVLCSLSVQDTPSSGSHTYELQLARVGPSATDESSAHNRGILYLETKK